MDQALAAQLEDFWRRLHRLWGLNSSGFYDKAGWAEFQTTAEELLYQAGLERRRMARAHLRRRRDD